jgi:HEAT repeat protein
VLAGIVAMIGERAVSPRVLFAIGLVVAGGAVYSMIRVRRAYAAELVAALREGRPHVFGAGPGAAEPFGLARADRAAAAVAVGAMTDPEAGVRRVAAELLGGFDTPGAIPALIRGVHDDDPEVRATALRSLARTQAFAASDVVPERLTDAAPEVRLAALDALDALRADRSRARALLGDPDGLVRARAAGILLKDAPSEASHEEAAAEGGSDPEAESTLSRLTRSPYAEVRVAALRALASSRGPATMHLAREGLSDPAPSVRAAAARTIVTVDPSGGVDVLLAAVGDGGDVLEAADVAMSRFPERSRDAVRRLAASASARGVRSRRLADSIEPAGDARLDLLRDFLLAGSRSDARTAIGAVALLADRGAIATALESLWSGDPAERADALEVLETTGDHHLVRPLLPLLEDGRLRELDRDWRERVLHHPDAAIRACAEWAIGATDIDATDTESRGGTMTETLGTLPLMERVLFLRRVPLFADLPPQDLMPIAGIAAEHSFADADTIAEQDEPGDEMHIIVSGYVMVILRQRDGHQQVLAVRSAGDVIGEMAVITSTPRMASLAAKGPVRLLSIGRRQFEAMLRERPETSLALMRVLCRRLVERETDAQER